MNEGEWKLGAIVDLNLPNWKRHLVSQLAQERETRMLIPPAVET